MLGARVRHKESCLEQSINLGRPAYKLTTLNIITAVFMTGFHVGAVAAHAFGQTKGSPR